MTAVDELLDKCRAARSIASDNALAGTLGIHRASISGWRLGRSWPSEEHIIALAKAAGVDAGEYLVRIHAERMKPGAAQKEWSKVLARITSAAAALVLSVGLIARPARATEPELSRVMGAPCILCKVLLIRFTAKRIIGTIFAALRTLFARRQEIAV